MNHQAERGEGHGEQKVLGGFCCNITFPGLKGQQPRHNNREKREREKRVKQLILYNHHHTRQAAAAIARQAPGSTARSSGISNPARDSEGFNSQSSFLLLLLSSIFLFFFLG
jgi:hypothetical protein